MCSMSTGHYILLFIIALAILLFFSEFRANRKNKKEYNGNALKNIATWITGIRNDIEEFQSNSIGFDRSFIRDVVEAADFFIATANLASLDAKLRELEVEFSKKPHGKILCDKIDDLWDTVTDMRGTCSHFNHRLNCFIASKKASQELLPQLAEKALFVSKTIHSYEVNRRLKFEFFGITEEVIRLQRLTRVIDCDWETTKNKLDHLVGELENVEKNIDDSNHYSLGYGEDNLEWMLELARDKLAKFKPEDLTEDGQKLFKEAKELLRLLDQLGLKNKVHFQTVFCMLLDDNSIINVILLNDLRTPEAKLRDSANSSQDECTANWREFATDPVDNPIEEDPPLVGEPNPH